MRVALELAHLPVVCVRRLDTLIGSKAFGGARVEHKTLCTGERVRRELPRLGKRRKRLLLDAKVLRKRHDEDLLVRHFELGMGVHWKREMCA
jgi:hypothetical protein